MIYNKKVKAIEAVNAFLNFNYYQKISNQYY